MNNLDPVLAGMYLLSGFLIGMLLNMAGISVLEILDKLINKLLRRK